MAVLGEGRLILPWKKRPPGSGILPEGFPGPINYLPRPQVPSRLDN
jgi:hypothetical protein